MGAACRSLRYELLMFLFAFEVSKEQALRDKKAAEKRAETAEKQ